MRAVFGAGGERMATYVQNVMVCPSTWKGHSHGRLGVPEAFPATDDILTMSHVILGPKNKKVHMFDLTGSQLAMDPPQPSKKPAHVYSTKGSV